MNSGRVLLRLTAALLVAGIANACSSDRGATRSVAGPGDAFDIREGAGIHGRLTRTLRVLDPDGTVRAESTTTAAFDAQVVGGKAAANGEGPLLAIMGTRPVPRRPISFTDSAGHRHEIQFEGGDNGAPVRAVRATLDGRPFAHVDFAWRRQGHGFLLAQRTTTFYGSDGRAVAREDQDADVQEVASAGVLERGVVALSTAVRAVALPRLLEAATMQAGGGCGGAWIEYLFASLGVAVAMTVVTEAWWLPISWTALGAAIGVWDKALDAVLPCMI